MTKRGVGTKLNELYERSGLAGVPVYCFAMPVSASMSVMSPNGECFIGVDPMLLESERDEREKLAHELGHCETGAFYNIFSPYDIREKCEHRADCRAIELLVPKRSLIELLGSGRTEPYELAELFDVSEELMRRALSYYFAE